MTLSPGQKVQPKRSTRISPGGVQRRLQLDIEGAGTKATPVHRAQHLDVAYGSEPEALRDALPHDRQQLSDAFFRVGRIDKEEVTALGRRKLWHIVLIDTMGIDDDPALSGLAEDLGQAHDWHGTRCDDVGERLSWLDRRQLINVTDEQQLGLVRQGVQQSPHQRHVDHRRLVDDEQITLERRLLGALESPGPGIGMSNRWMVLASSPVLSDGRLAARPVGAQSDMAVVLVPRS
jgi:hypothetical protein